MMATHFRAGTHGSICGRPHVKYVTDDPGKVDCRQCRKTEVFQTLLAKWKAQR